MKQQNLFEDEELTDAVLAQKRCAECHRELPELLLTPLLDIGDCCPDCHDFHNGVER